ncbi:MAG: 4'-phosphopantetheinyl transferase superfamily protein [Actinocatenispora sp.]
MTTADLTVRTRAFTGDQRTRAHALLREVAGRMAGTSAPLIRVSHADGGQPYVDVSGLSVSVSHTADLVAVAVSRLGPVGVDVEQVRAMPAVDLGRRWYAEVEADWLRELPAEARTVAFLRLWTGKEAVGKLYGRGLRNQGMSRRVPLPVRWSSGGDAAHWLSTPDDPGVLVCYRDVPGHVLAVAAGTAVRTGVVDIGPG